MRRRDLDGCPIAGALQVIGDKWTMLIIRDLVHGPRRTMELHTNLQPISSRTLVGRLRDLVADNILERTDFGGNPPHIEYGLTARGRLLIPLLDALREAGQLLNCNECEDRKKRRGAYCETCPSNGWVPVAAEPISRPVRQRRQRDDSIVLL
ncbi:MAG: helix-turn-helix domain-containing protein [Pyrinomonadaceae bacterium]